MNSALRKERAKLQNQQGAQSHTQKETLERANTERHCC